MRGRHGNRAHGQLVGVADRRVTRVYSIANRDTLERLDTETHLSR